MKKKVKKNNVNNNLQKNTGTKEIENKESVKQEKKNLWQRMQKKERILFIIAIIVMLSNLFYYELYKGNARWVKFEVSPSKIYSQRDVTTAVEVVRNDFKENYNGYRMQKVKYKDDYLDKEKETNSEVCCGIYEGKDVIVIKVDFKPGPLAPIIGKKITSKSADYNFVLVRENKKSDWKIVYKAD